MEVTVTQKDMRGGNYAAELQPKEVYRERRRRLAERAGGGTIVLWGSGDERGYGDVGTFRQSSNFFYLTGVELPNAILAIRPGEGGDLLFLPPRDPAVERWTGPKWGPGDEAADVFGFDEVLSLAPSEIVLDARIRPVPGFEGRLLLAERRRQPGDAFGCQTVVADQNARRATLGFYRLPTATGYPVQRQYAGWYHRPSFFYPAMSG